MSACVGCGRRPTDDHLGCSCKTCCPTTANTVWLVTTAEPDAEILGAFDNPQAAEACRAWNQVAFVTRVRLDRLFVSEGGAS